MPSGAASGPFGGTRNLADIIMQKIQEREAGGAPADRLQDGERACVQRTLSLC